MGGGKTSNRTEQNQQFPGEDASLWFECLLADWELFFSCDVLRHGPAKSWTLDPFVLDLKLMWKSDITCVRKVRVLTNLIFVCVFARMRVCVHWQVMRAQLPVDPIMLEEEMSQVTRQWIRWSSLETMQKLLHALASRLCDFQAHASFASCFDRFKSRVTHVPEDCFTLRCMILLCSPFQRVKILLHTCHVCLWSSSCWSSACHFQTCEKQLHVHEWDSCFSHIAVLVWRSRTCRQLLHLHKSRSCEFRIDLLLLSDVRYIALWKSDSFFWLFKFRCIKKPYLNACG